MLYGCLGVGQAAFTFLVYMVACIDNQLALAIKFGTLAARVAYRCYYGDPAVLTLSGVVGSIIVVAFLEPYFGLCLYIDIICELLVFFFIFIGYSYIGAFYRASAHEIKRLGTLLCFALFCVPTFLRPNIRSYGEVKYYVDLENRALYLLVTNQRWLAIRLEFAGGVLVFLVAILAVTNVSGINPAQIGLVLTYTIIILAADVENSMNAVERLMQYVEEDTVPQEAPHEIEERKPPAQWPEHGAVDFNNVMMAYMPGLPNVLRGILVKVRGGEKIGVIGRTGAGKSSLMLSLFRIVELSGGSVAIDGVDISTIGLTDLRSKISIIPQDPIVFSD
ncbi:hypothetical protein EDB19DRAFT_1766238 [Suillus lakei]|nr:hypothetical protein EDB19DRAFT_1766238 [Suillus lakei]